MENRSRALVQLLVVAGLSLVLFVFAGWLAVRVATSGPRDEVPDLTGLSVAEARERLATHGMEAEVEEARLQDTDLPPEHVARQIPGAGTPVKRMRVVRLTLAAGPRERDVPEMVGESRSRAVIALQQQDFAIDYVAVAPSRRVPRDRIIAQEPRPIRLEPGETAPVRLLTSLGPPPRHYVMPDLVGEEMRQVRPWLESLGFRVTEGANRRIVANIPAGTIVNQRPNTGVRIGHGGEIVLEVSR